MQRPIRTLLVDDSDDIRLLLRLMLESDQGFEVCGEAADGEAAVELAAVLSPDAIVLDLRMPVMDGLTALPLLRGICPEAAVVVLTAAPAPGVAQVALGLGACAVLVKQDGAGKLLETLQAGCAQLAAL